MSTAERRKIYWYPLKKSPHFASAQDFWCHNSVTDHCASKVYARCGMVGRGRGVGRGLGVALGMGVGLPLGEGVATGVEVGDAVGVTVGVAVGCLLTIWYSTPAL